MLARRWQGGWSAVYPPPPTLLPQSVKTTPRFTVRPLNAGVVSQTPVGAGVLDLARNGLVSVARSFLWRWEWWSG